jgi:hypothetical protein
MHSFNRGLELEIKKCLIFQQTMSDYQRVIMVKPCLNRLKRRCLPPLPPSRPSPHSQWDSCCRWSRPGAHPVAISAGRGRGSVAVSDAKSRESPHWIDDGIASPKSEFLIPGLVNYPAWQTHSLLLNMAIYNIYSGFTHWKIVMVHSYVRLPEGNSLLLKMAQSK